MTNPTDAHTRATLDKLLEEHGLTRDTLLFREAMRDALIRTDTPDVYRLPANPAPSESVVDVYGQSYVIQAEQAGPGLTFAESTRPNWQETMEMRVMKSDGDPLDAVEVEVSLGDILAQGGLVYPVESVVVERAWYCTLPAGSVTVRALPSFGR